MSGTSVFAQVEPLRKLKPFVFWINSLQRRHAESETWTSSRCVSVHPSSVTSTRARSHFSSDVAPRLAGYSTNSWALTYSLTLFSTPPPTPSTPHLYHPSPPRQHSPVDVSRVTILPVSMTTTCCCPPLICLSSLPPLLHSLSLSLSHSLPLALPPFPPSQLSPFSPHTVGISRSKRVTAR